MFRTDDKDVTYRWRATTRHREPARWTSCLRCATHARPQVCSTVHGVRQLTLASAACSATIIEFTIPQIVKLSQTSALPLPNVRERTHGAARRGLCQEWTGTARHCAARHGTARHRPGSARGSGAGRGRGSTSMITLARSFRRKRQLLRESVQHGPHACAFDYTHGWVHFCAQGHARVYAQAPLQTRTLIMGRALAPQTAITCVQFVAGMPRHMSRRMRAPMFIHTTVCMAPQTAITCVQFVTGMSRHMCTHMSMHMAHTYLSARLHAVPYARHRRPCASTLNVSACMCV